MSEKNPADNGQHPHDHLVNRGDEADEKGALEETDEEDEDLEPLILTLSDEEGDERSFQLLQVLEVEGQQYGVLVPLVEEEEEEETESTNEIIVLRMVEDGEEEYFEEIDDEEEFQRVVTVLDQMAQDAELGFGTTRRE